MPADEFVSTRKWRFVVMVFFLSVKRAGFSPARLCREALELSYRFWWKGQDSNLQPPDYTGALPTELPSQ
jgi:hypothetical protein